MGSLYKRLKEPLELEGKMQMWYVARRSFLNVSEELLAIEVHKRRPQILT